jgi:hypothetical protein
MALYLGSRLIQIQKAMETADKKFRASLS